MADLTAAQSKVIPATPTADTCPVNEIIMLSFGVVGPTNFNRADVNTDGKNNITDAVIIIKEVFGKTHPGVDCRAAYDTNNDNTVAIDDGIFLLNWIFRRGDRPADPFQGCGIDEDDRLLCASSNCQ